MHYDCYGNVLAQLSVTDRLSATSLLGLRSHTGEHRQGRKRVVVFPRSAVAQGQMRSHEIFDVPDMIDPAAMVSPVPSSG